MVEMFESVAYRKLNEVKDSHVLHVHNTIFCLQAKIFYQSNCNTICIIILELLFRKNLTIPEKRMPKAQEYFVR
jgi:hypothetical protein